MNKTSTLFTQGQFIDFCEKVFGRSSGTGSTHNISVVCPYCKKIKGKTYNKKKLAIHTDSHVLHCWVCNYKSKSPIHIIKKFHPNHLNEYLSKFANKENIVYYENLEANKNQRSDSFKDNLELPKGFSLLATLDATTNKQAYASRNYLKARGIDSDEMMWYWRLGITNASEGFLGRIIIPSLDAAGKLNYFTARTIRKNVNPKYENPDVEREDIVFNEINIDWTKELTITEGAFDLFKCNENATCILGSELPGHFDLFQKIATNRTPVVLALDPDAIKKAYKIAFSLLEFDVQVRVLHLKKNQEDVGSISKNEFKSLLDDATLFNKEFYLRNKINQLI